MTDCSIRMLDQLIVMEGSPDAWSEESEFCQEPVSMSLTQYKDIRAQNTHKHYC